MNPSNPSTAVYSDTVVRQFALMSVVWGVVGMLVGVIIASQLAWPELNLGHDGELADGGVAVDRCGRVGNLHRRAFSMRPGQCLGETRPTD